MDTQLLNAFITVAEKESFSKAADQLGLTQSAISKRIALLEEQLGHALFDRVGRKIFLTEAGQTLLPRAKAIIDAVEDTQRLMEQQHQQVEGTLRLATSHHIGIHRLPPILKNYTQQYPNVYLQLHFIDSEQATKAILEGEFDLAIITLPADIDEAGNIGEHTNIQCHTLWHDPMQIVVSHQHALNQQHSIAIEELSSYPAILPDMNTRTSQLVSQLFSDANAPLNVAMTTNHLDAIKMMVSVGLGWSALPQTMIDQGLHRLTLKNMQLHRDLGCIHHRQRILSNAARTFLQTLKNH